MKLGEKLRLLRKQHGLKQGGLARTAGLTTNKIQRYEQSSQTPKGDDALALAKVLGVTTDYLLDDTLPYPPAEEHLSEKVVIIRQLEGLIGALLSHEGEDRPPEAVRPDVTHLPVLKLGAGFDVVFDAAGLPAGEPVGDMYFSGLGEGKFFAAELYGSSMRGPGTSGFSLGEILVFKVVERAAVASGDYVYVRAQGHGLFRQAFLHGDRFRFRALNPADPEVWADRAEVEHIGRLVRRIKHY